MMPRYLLSLLLLIPILLSGQDNQEYVSFQRHGRFNALDLGPNRDLVAAGSTGSCPVLYLSYFGSSGTLAWENKLDYSLLFPATDVFFDQQYHIVVVGTESEADDYGVPEDGIFLLKMDTLGNIIFNKKISLGSLYRETVRAVQLHNTNYLLGIGNQLAWMSSEGDSLRTLELEMGNDKILDLQEGPDSSILVVAKTQWWWLDQEGNILDQQLVLAGERLIGAAQRTDTIWMLGTEHLWVFPANSSELEVFPLPEDLEKGGITPIRNGGGLLIWGKAEEEYHWFEWSNGQWITRNFDFDNTSVINDLAATTANLYATGRDLWEPEAAQDFYMLHGAFVRTVAAAMEPEAFYDLSVRQVTLDLTPTLDTVDQYILADTILYEVFARFTGTVTVANTGNRPVDEFILFSDRQGGFNCSEGRYYEAITEVELLPGQTLDIPIMITEWSFTYAPDPPIFSRCFYVAAPNHRADQNAANNYACAALIVLGSREVALASETVTVFPNPARDMVQVKLEPSEKIEDLSLYDLNGRLLPFRGDIRYHEATLHTEALPPGLYLLQVRTSQGIARKKILIQ